MTEQKNKKIAIIGGGLGGSFLAILLANRGYKVALYEKLSKHEICDTNSKRSYNITFYAYGVDILKKANLWEMVKPHLLPLKGVSTQLSKDSAPIFSPIYNDKAQYYAMSRAKLLDLLLEEISKHPSITVHFETSLLAIDKHERTLMVQDEKTKNISIISADIIIGSDGTNSLVRSFIQVGQHTNHTQEYSSGGYKQFTISKQQLEELGLKPNVGYTWSAKEKFILAFPNHDGSLAALLIYQKDIHAFDLLNTSETLKKLINNEFPLLQPAQNDIIDQLLFNPIGTFVTIHTDPWYYKDFIVLVGDAAHGFYPFFGQGTSVAFGDCMLLATLLDSHDNDWTKVLPLYQQKRKKHMDALGELSKDGLRRYARNKRADYDAIYDKLEFVGHSLFPKYIKPPVFAQVLNDPEHAGDYVESHRKQRRMAKKIGIAMVVPVIIGLVALREEFQKLISRK
jgi:kynurenine 3-monooxygenase